MPMRIKVDESRGASVPDFVLDYDKMGTSFKEYCDVEKLKTWIPEPTPDYCTPLEKLDRPLVVDNMSDFKEIASSNFINFIFFYAFF